MNFFRSIYWCWSSACGVRWRVVLSTLLGVVHALLALAFVFASKMLVDIATKVADGELSLWVYILIGIVALQLLLRCVRQWIDSQSEIALLNGLRYKYFDRVLRSAWSGREQFHTGDAVNRLDRDLGSIVGAVIFTLPSIVTSGVQLVGSFIYLNLLSSSLSWTLLAIMPIVLIISKVYIGRIRSLTHAIRNSESRVQSYMQESLRNRTTINLLESEGYTLQQFGGHQDDLRTNLLSRVRYTMFSRTVVQAGFAVGYVVVLVWGVYGLDRGVLSFGAVAAFLQLVSQVQSPVVELGQRVSGLFGVVASVDRILDIEGLHVESCDAERRLSGGVGVRFEGVDFGYSDGDKLVLEGFDCDFEPGSFGVIVGETGAGKSTLLRLIAALLRPDRGRVVLYSGADGDVEASIATRSNIVYVPQGSTLVSGTIRDNLRLGCATASDEDMMKALHVAAADFVAELADGLSTMCGEGGAGLSEGQAQRISIARGLLRDGGVVVMDEPTSALDSATELLFLSRLGEYVGERTVIMVTHRENIATYCSNVVNLL
ncbi:MAG: ABC transporter ATP-binding protein [Rikenellaceae bacterium]